MPDQASKQVDLTGHVADPDRAVLRRLLRVSIVDEAASSESEAIPAVRVPATADFAMIDAQSTIPLRRLFAQVPLL